MLHTLLSRLMVIHNIHIIHNTPIHRLPIIQHVMRHIARIIAIAHVLFDQKPAECTLPLVHNRCHIAMTKVAVQSNIKRKRPRTRPGLLCVRRGGAGAVLVEFARSGHAPGPPRKLVDHDQGSGPGDVPHQSPSMSPPPKGIVSGRWPSSGG